MPSLGLQIVAQGPIIDVFVGVSGARLSAIRAAGQPDPPLVRARMLVDTGASTTNVCQSVIGQLNIAPTGQVPVFTPSTGNTPVLMNQYDVNFYLGFTPTVLGVLPPGHTIPNVPVTCANFTAQGIQGLVGRDILQNATFVYHGHMNLFTLSF